MVEGYRHNDNYFRLRNDYVSMGVELSERTVYGGTCLEITYYPVV